MTPVVPLNHQEAYTAEDLALRRQRSMIGCWLAMTLMPAGLALDWVMYPQHLFTFGLIRLSATALVVIVYLFHHQKHSLPIMSALNIAWVAIINIGIAAMIAVSEGSNSPYYAGLNLVFFAMGLLMPLTWREALITCLIGITAYLVACDIHGGLINTWRILFNNLYFLSLTALVCTIASWAMTRSRIRDFLLRRDLAETNQQLAEADRMKTEFFANISHELRTPLTLILGPIDDLLTRPDPLPDRLARPLGIARQNGLRLLRLINDLLELMRIDQFESPTSSERATNLHIHLNGIIQSLHFLTTSKGITLSCDIPKGNTSIALAPEQFDKALTNLLTNAIKFTPSGGEIRITPGASTDTHSVFHISDTGIGIPSDQLPFIFERFRQVDGSTTRAFQGVGIGLALVKSIIDDSGGQIDVTSAVNEGTTFTLHLPLSTTGANTEHHAAIGGDQIVALNRLADQRGAVMIDGDVDQIDEISGSGEDLVLVIDDEPDMRRYLVDALSKHYRVATAIDGSSGIAACAKLQPDAVIVDYMLPGMDGIEICRILNQEHSEHDLRLLLLTARTDEQVKLDALSGGAHDFLNKPFSMLELTTRVDNLISNRKLSQTLRQALAQLQETESQLVQSEKVRALGDMASGLMHEINNPLNFATAATSLLKEELPADDNLLQETIADILDGMGRIKRILSDLRIFAYPSKAESRAPIVLGDLIDTALRLTSHEHGPITVKQQIPDEAVVFGSHDQLTHVFINLISNACKAIVETHGESANGILSIDASTADHHLEIHVRDNGVGIAPENLERIFHPFFTTRGPTEGTGLGLSLSQTIINNHAGSMRASSQPGHGTDITISLPLHTLEHVA